jgi:DNA-binding CsgD family transcriptional regulator
MAGGQAMWKPVLLYGLLLAFGTAALQWLDYLTVVRARSFDLYVVLIATAFLTLGIYAGWRLFGLRRPATTDGNPEAQGALGISPRELEVLRELAAGHSSKEIARRLAVSPNTVKTHVSRLLEKLGARRRTEAVQRARELGLLG